MKKYFTKLKGLAVDLYTDITGHWKKPGKGNFVSYKEMMNYSVGGMGQKMLILFIGYFALGATNTLLGSTIGISPMHLQTMAVVQQVLNVFLYLLRSKIVDNTRTKWGRFRPYMFFASIPVLALGIAFLFLDFEVMSYNTKLLYVFAFAIAISSVSPLLTETYTELATVITPNSRERAKFFSVTSIVFSFAPTIYQFLIPLFSKYTGGYTHINTYRYIIAPLAVLGFMLNMFVVFGCKEKVVTSKTYVQKISTIKGCLQIYRNKYWWIRTLAGTLGFLEGTFNALFLWTFMYQAQDMTTYAFLVTIQGSASLIAMVITPWLLKKLGNRKLLLYQNAINIIFITCMLFTFKLPGLFFVFLFINTILNQLAIVFGPVMHSEVKDYQQYISGKRLDFTFSAAGQILLPITIMTGYVVPLVYESLGLTTNYDVMYDPVMRNKLFSTICLLSMLGAALNLIPYFFYRMTRAKHKMIINVLHLRAGLEDYASGDISPYAVKAMIDGVNEYLEVMNTEKIDLKADRLAIKQAKDMPRATEQEKLERKALIKELRAQYVTDQYLVELKEGAVEIFKPEMEKYDSEFMQNKIVVDKYISEMKIEDLHTLNMNDIKLDKVGKDKKEAAKITKYINKTTKAIDKMTQSIIKNYPNGLVENNRERLDAALEMPHDTKEQHKVRATAIRLAEKEYNKYCMILELYFDSTSHYKQYFSKIHFNEIEEMFEDSVRHIEEQEALAQAEEDRLKKLHREELDRILSSKKKRKQNDDKENIKLIDNITDETITDDIDKTIATKEDENNSEQNDPTIADGDNNREDKV